MFSSLVIKCIKIDISLFFFCFLSAPPKIDKEIKDQQVEVGEQLKLKIPISGTGPFEVKVKKDNRELPESDRFKVTPFDDYVVMVLKGKCTCFVKNGDFYLLLVIEIYSCSSQVFLWYMWQLSYCVWKWNCLQEHVYHIYFTHKIRKISGFLMKINATNQYLVLKLWNKTLQIKNGLQYLKLDIKACQKCKHNVQMMAGALDK